MPNITVLFTLLILRKKRFSPKSSCLYQLQDQTFKGYGFTLCTNLNVQVALWLSGSNFNPDFESGFNTWCNKRRLHLVWIFELVRMSSDRRTETAGTCSSAASFSALTPPPHGCFSDNKKIEKSCKWWVHACFSQLSLAEFNIDAENVRWFSMFFYYYSLLIFLN